MFALLALSDTHIKKTLFGFGAFHSKPLIATFFGITRF
jgi:hypothetical protein